MISGSQYNTDLVDDFKKVVGALQDKWPDVLHEDPLLIKEGGREAGWVTRVINFEHCQLPN